MFEINLVPDLKAEMIKAQKMRNVVFFISAVIAMIAVGMVLVLISIRTAQNISISEKDEQLMMMSKKLEEYDDLDQLLTIQEQLNGLSQIDGNKKVLSRVFTFLSALLPSGADTIQISSLNVNLEDSTISFDGQANAGAGTDGIDYRVLESFTKQVELMKYDYGRYVDASGNEIPSRCIVETDDLGQPFVDSEGYFYAKWTRNVKDCDPSVSSDSEYASSGTSTSSGINSNVVKACQGTGDECIYRTPFLKENDSNNWYSRGYMKTDGTIEGVPHFESQCITYSGVEYSGKITWSNENNCQLAPEGIVVSNSSNGRESGGGLVLRFSATIYMNPEVFLFSNKHMFAMAPTGRTNVTDSFVQSGNMFSERAMDGEEGDTSCRN